MPYTIEYERTLDRYRGDRLLNSRIKFLYFKNINFFVLKISFIDLISKIPKMMASQHHYLKTFSLTRITNNF